MNQVDRPIPHSVAFALATLSQPSGLTAFVRVYGPDRGLVEWEAHYRSKQEAAQKAEAAKVLDQAWRLAVQHGWNWQEVEAAAREDHPRLFPEEAA